MWYVIQTITGKEEELARLIRKVIPESICRDSFYLRRECRWRIRGGYKSHIEGLFPGYIFAVTDKPEELFFALKAMPRFARLLGDCGSDTFFFHLPGEEEAFLKNLVAGDPGHVVRLSQVETNGQGKIIRAKGPLERYTDRIVTQRLRKRCVYVEVDLGGRRRRVFLGVIMKNDLASSQGENPLGRRREGPKYRGLSEETKENEFSETI